MKMGYFVLFVVLVIIFGASRSDGKVDNSGEMCSKQNCKGCLYQGTHCYEYRAKDIDGNWIPCNDCAPDPEECIDSDGIDCSAYQSDTCSKHNCKSCFSQGLCYGYKDVVCSGEHCAPDDTTPEVCLKYGGVDCSVSPPPSSGDEFDVEAKDPCGEYSGIFGGKKVCCADTCTNCGWKGCAKEGAKCCRRRIRKRGKVCGESQTAPCIIQN